MLKKIFCNSSSLPNYACSVCTAKVMNCLFIANVGMHLCDHASLCLLYVLVSEITYIFSKVAKATGKIGIQAA